MDNVQTLRAAHMWTSKLVATCFNYSASVLCVRLRRPAETLGNFREYSLTQDERQLASEVIDQCEKCMKGHNDSHHPMPIGHIPFAHQLHTLLVDVIGHFPTVQVLKFIVSFTKVFSRYDSLLATPCYKVTVLDKILRPHIEAYFSVPPCLHEDRGF